MALTVDNGVDFKRAPTRSVALPRLDGVPVRRPSLLDRVSNQFNERWSLLATGAGIGAAGTALLVARSGSSIVGRFGAGALGALGSTALLVGGGVLIDTLRRTGTESVTTAAAAGAAVAGSTPGATEQLRVMSFNIHGSAGPGGETFGSEADLERVARAIERERPDVVLLQEVDDHAVQSLWRDHLARLADRLDADGAVHATSHHTVTGRRNGTAVLTFNGVRVADARSIVSPDHEGESTPRRLAGSIDAAAGWVSTKLTGTTWAPFDTPMYRPRATTDVMVTTPAGTAVRVLSGHWSWPADGVDHPRRQIDPLAALLGAWDGPTIVGGDFNVRSATRDGDREAAAFARVGIRDAFTAVGIPLDSRARNSFGGARPHVSIDRIYASNDIDVTSARVGSHVVDGIHASDHHPVVVDYRITAA